jgi:hypothetical protein
MAGGKDDGASGFDFVDLDLLALPKCLDKVEFFAYDPDYGDEPHLTLIGRKGKRGKSEESRRWLDKATVWLDQYPGGMQDRAEEELGLHLHNWLEAHVLRREAEELIGRPARAVKRAGILLQR